METLKGIRIDTFELIQLIINFMGIRTKKFLQVYIYMYIYIYI
jgi:hypothetical protein